MFQELREGEFMADVFEETFKCYAKNFTGTEAEITVYKVMAKQWFDAGLREGMAIMDHKALEGVDALRTVRAALDEAYAFQNNIR